MYRLLSVGIVISWAAAMGTLFMRDVYPAWTAQDAPPMTHDQLARFGGHAQQLGIYDGQGKRRGTAWSDISSAGSNTAIHGTIYLEDLPMVPVLLVETSTEFDEKGELDNFTLQVFGVPLTTIRVHGERHGIYFPCEIHVGPLFRQANLEMAASCMLGESFRPFSYLPTLKVGQSWRMQVIDPLSAALGSSTRFVPVVARVTGKEMLAAGNGSKECFVVETSPGQAKAWVDPEGHVLKQEVNVPGFGKLSVVDEKYEEDARARVRNRVRHESDGGGRHAIWKRLSAPVDALRKSISKSVNGVHTDGRSN